MAERLSRFLRFGSASSAVEAKRRRSCPGRSAALLRRCAV